MYRILLICTGNTCRSPMLQALLKEKLKKFDKKVEVKSVGVSVGEGDKVTQEARNALKSYNIVIRHKPIQLKQEDLQRADTVITMTEEIKKYLSGNICAYKIYSMRQAVGFNVPDPFGFGTRSYSECAAVLDKASDIIVENLKKAGKI
ncbi:MAG: hypothetical protein IJS74_00600 [Clostridia bacterium]|nr:hypothetical protein [Clostridia bacterium]